MSKTRELSVLDAAGRSAHEARRVAAEHRAVPRHGDGAEAAGAEDDKLLRVGELAQACGKTVRAIHHYEDVGLLTPATRSKGRYRLYASEAVARVRWIGKLHDLGMTLSEIHQILAAWEQAPSAPDAMAAVHSVYLQKLQEVRQQIGRMTALEHELHQSLRYLDTCESCAPDELIAACSGCEVRDCDTPEPDLVAGLYASGQPSKADEELN